MKLILCLATFFLFSMQSFALNIRQTVVSRISDQAINISLDTEADELYYFSSWQFEMFENTIILQVCFIEGFGSTIAFLNNNFEIPLNSSQTRNYYLVVEVYYESFRDENLEDFQRCFFTTPIENPLQLSTNLTDQTAQNAIKFVNPSDGKIFTGISIEDVAIFDEGSRILYLQDMRKNLIDISNLPNGSYFLQYVMKGIRKTARVILRKN